MRLVCSIAIMFAGCSAARASESSGPDTPEVEASEPLPPLELGPAPEGCLIEAYIPSEATVGRYG